MLSNRRFLCLIQIDFVRYCVVNRLERPGTACPAEQELGDCGALRDRYLKVRDENTERSHAMKILFTT